MTNITRRRFGGIIAAALATGWVDLLDALERVPDGSITAAEVIERIRRNIGVDWRSETVDTVKAGEPSAAVTGIVTTALATLDVLQAAAATGANMIVTSGPTFYGRADSRTAPAGPVWPGGATDPPALADPPASPDPIYEAKNRFIDENRLVVFRLSDHWERREPDPFARGLAEQLGWTTPVPGNVARYDLAPVSLEALAKGLKQRLGALGGIRVVGNSAMTVRRVALLPGTTAIAASLEAMPDADVVVAGEVREWESVEYARDLVYSGQSKALILLGRVVSEDPGMALAARWLKSFVTEVPVRHLSAGDPYWRPSV